MSNRNRRRSVEIKFFVTPKEKEDLDARVKKTGLTRSEFLRRAYTGARINEKPQAEIKDLLSQLSHLGNNVNQIARRENAMGIQASAELLCDVSEKIYQLITDIRKEVIT